MACGSILSTKRRLGGRWHFLFKVHTQAIGNPVDIVEVADNLCSITDGLRAKASCLQFGDINLRGRMRIAR